MTPCCFGKLPATTMKLLPAERLCKISTATARQGPSAECKKGLELCMQYFYDNLTIRSGHQQQPIIQILRKLENVFHSNLYKDTLLSLFNQQPAVLLRD